MIKIKRFHPDAIVPERKTPGAVAWDLHLCLPGPRYIDPGETMKISCGWGFEIPVGFCGLVLPRTSWAHRGINTFHPPIDSDYRGEVHIIVNNASREMVLLNPGDRCAQLLITVALVQPLEEVEELSPTVRGTGAFGSTGGAPR